MKSLTTLSLPSFNTKLLLIRFNRMLAWALLISPAVQIMVGTGFLRGLVFDLVLLLIHALLSLIVFGTPRAASFRNQHTLRRFFGGDRALVLGRDRFLLDAWRILISLLNPWVMGMLAYAVTFAAAFVNIIGLLFLPLISALLYFNLLLPASILRHVRDASSYAYRRWRLSPTEARWLGWATMWVFVVLSFVNLVKGLWL
ncbi:hypothetical protein [Variovorax sp. PCZ-1]|uniref:hypothetical protein n=1 Tax=Variovorax sp. PCZ-1 TaxID=2835533 RepID=UPI001BCBF1F1|nr:hypothetical protein [Variovorax sp. PCZ-1]MBS7808440.1 hypothetical protein [Variovorax sp. PCZ-1]